MKKMMIVLTALTLLAGTATTAQAKGGYLHMREANALARVVANKTDGVVVLSPCVRTSSHTASCAMRQIFKPQHVVCDYTIRVFKRSVSGRVSWAASAGRADCEYVG